jgi:LPXTG-motif cell wall-anchored protein
MTAAEVDNISILGGALASVDLLSSKLGADALLSQADGVRGVDIGTVKLLDLGALLKGLGADLQSLPIGAVSDLLTKLGLPVSGLTAGTSLSSEVTAIGNALTDLRNTLVGATTTITSTVTNATSGLLSSLHLNVPDVGSLVTTVNNTITSLQNQLVGLLSNALSALDSFPLIQITGAQFGVATKAADTVGNSAAAVALSPLQITVAGIKLPTIDASAVVNTVNGVLAQANGLLGGVLSTIGLPTDLLSLSLLQQAHQVSQNANYTTATAGLTVLNLKIGSLDPTVILNAISKLVGPTVSSLLGSNPLTSVLGSTSAMGAVNSLLGQTATLLNGAQLQIASLAGASTYTLAPPPVGVTGTSNPVSLPHTGGNPALPIFGVIITVLGLGVVRYRRFRTAHVPSDQH